MAISCKRILVPVALERPDEIALAEEAVEAASALAKTQKEASTLVLIYVEEPLLEPGETKVSADAVSAFREILRVRTANAEEELRKLEERVKGAGLSVEAHAITDVKGVAEEIVEAAKKYTADIVVVSSHSRKGLRRFFLGSVSERVAHLSPVPVLLLPTPEG